VRLLLLFPIYLYWHIWPSALKKRQCLFKESCSHYIWRVTSELGFSAGCKALVDRYYNCRPGYRVTMNDKGEFQIRLVTGAVVSEQEIADAVIKPYLGLKDLAR